MKGIRVHKEYDGEWLVYNYDTGASAKIVRYNHSYGFIKEKSQYRIDVNGKTIATGIESYRKAESMARKSVKGVAV